jgi:hypothetical protein
MAASVSTLLVTYRLVIIAFFAFLFSLITVNSGEFYSKVFKDEKGDFTSADVPFRDRFGPLTRYAGFFVLFVFVYFLAIVVFISLVYVINEKDKAKSVMKVLEEKLLPVIWGKSDSPDTAFQFYIWLLISTIMTLLFFLFYSLVNKSFLQEMKFPTFYGKDPAEADVTAEDADRPQPKIFLVFYALFCLMVLCFGVVLMSVGGSDTDYMLLIINLLSMIVLVVIMVTTYEMILRKNLLYIFMIVLLLGVAGVTMYEQGLITFGA